MRQDIEQFARVLLAVGSDPFLTSSKRDFTDAKAASLVSCDHELSRRQFWQIISKLAASLNDGHVAISPNFQTQRQPPVTFAIRNDESLIATTVLKSSMRDIIGSRIVQINGISAETLVSTALDLRGAQTPALRRVLADVSATLESLLFDPREYIFEFIDRAGMKRAMTSVAARECDMRHSKRACPPFEFRRLSGGIALIIYRACQQPIDFSRFLNSAFVSMSRDRPRALIIDLRNNVGGDSSLNDMLFAYLTDQEYHQSASVRIGDSRALAREMGLLEYTRRFGPTFACGQRLVAIKKRRPRIKPLVGLFSGPVYFLIGPSTFSSAQMCALTVKQFRIGTLVGEALGEPATSTGETFSFRLANSKFTAHVTTRTWITEGYDRFDVLKPDVAISTIEGRSVNGFDQDPAIQAVRRHVRAGTW